MKTLIIIPARAGSKELPGKNTRLLNGKPLVGYSIEFAMKIKGEEDVICVSSNDDAVLDIAKQYGLEVPFKRPEELATDSAGSYEVILHAIKHYDEQNKHFDAVLLLQPTSPLRAEGDYQAMKEKFTVSDCEMVVSVKRSKESPYFTLFEETRDGFLEKSKKADYKTRQDCPPVYIFNGSMYLIAVAALKARNMQQFARVAMVEMPEERSVDIDSMKDWIVTEYFLNTFHT